ncbi:nucleolar protein 8 [Brienomyrus brachyistius]|uniref:nucleolar protein 8 n=1 Tax=Brienomyrus brachyistius TaxID=42636 RepID=UPI0020B36180|nr:nucleolar protein 8 [Brienomyrus brachyistius]
MQEAKDVKRLYIGGLSHTISQKDIKDRFGKFGEVSDVEIVTREDLTGVPLKTFGYININISDASLKKCMTVLNKSRWKGETLQIEVAKESFLHRLALERQQAAAKTQTSKVDPKETLMDSFKKAGVENFHMKSAVPGTEVPGHKDWVVSKFGRVLPVLHLKNQVKKKVFKYDPSKHCHNIKRLETEMTNETPVSNLTWEILDADNEISKKRRGEFPPQKSLPAKIRKNSVSRILMESYLGAVRDSQPKEEKQRRLPNGAGKVQLLQDVSENHGSSAPKKHECSHLWDSDVDSEEEIKMLVESEDARSLEMNLGNEVDLEVVGDDFVLTPNILRVQGSKISEELDDERDYDSADTDEILSNCRSSGKQKVITETINSANTKLEKNSETKATRGKRKASSKLITGDFSQSGKSSSDEEDTSGNEDSDYEAMMANCYRLELSLADLENLAKGPSASSEEDCQRPTSHKEPSQSSAAVLPHKTKPSAAKSGNTPDAILAAILADDSSDEMCDRMKKKRKTSSLSLPAFVGTKSLCGLMNGAQPDFNVRRKKQEDFMMTESESKPTLGSSSDSVLSEKQSDDTETPTNQPKDKAVNSKPLSINGDMAAKRENGESEEASSSEDEEAERSPKKSKRQPKIKVKSNDAPSCGSQPSLSDTQYSASGDSKGNRGQIKDVVLPKMPQSYSEKTEPHNKTPQCPGIARTSEKQQEDNQKRLAALEQKQKEAEQQKKLIQSALSKLDKPGTSQGKHVVFYSDDESEEEVQVATENPSKTLFEDSSELSEDSASEVEPGKLRQSSKDFTVKEFQKQGGSKLFLSSEDEDDEEEEEDDDQRFHIKPQFEGKAGQKLMKLQSRFGTDERFRMDSRFLESDEEASTADPKSCSGLEVELEEEKKKNLNILESVLHVGLQASEASKESVKSKTFRDVSALHYDPTKEEHAAFETKPEEPKKESKAARRKKREAAEKLPEVSKDIFYNVAMDLKEVFGPTDIADGKDPVAWDKKDEETTKELDNRAGNATTESESSGFRFSFFGDDPVEDTTVKDDYKVELLKGAKVAWQADPRFQDSSSEEEEEEEKEQEEEYENQPQPASSNEGPVQPKKTFFFFFEDDERLKEGPKMFCRMGKLEDQRETWEETRSLLIEEYRKKHKNAKRRAKTSWKS